MRVWDLPVAFKMCSKNVVIYMFFHGFWEALGIGLGTQKPSENLWKHMVKNHWFFNGFWFPFWRYVGSQNGTKLWLKSRSIFKCIFTSVWDQKWSQKGAPWEAKWRWKSRHFDGYSRPTPTTPPRTDFGRVLGRKSAPISGFWEPAGLQIGGKMEGFFVVWWILANPRESDWILANPSVANSSEF